MSSAASKRPGEIVSAEQMFNNLCLFLVSLGPFLLLLEKAHPPAGGKAALCWGSAVLLLGVTGRSAGLCPSPFCRQGNRHTATLELPNSQLRPEPQVFPTPSQRCRRCQTTQLSWCLVSCCPGLIASTPVTPAAGTLRCSTTVKHLMELSPCILCGR